MFERFTDRARRVLVLAQEEAKALEHNFIGTEHLLLGMLHEGEGVAARALVELGLDLDTVRERVIEVITRGAPGTAEDRPPFTPRSKHVLEHALREALDLGHNYIGTEHLLLGLLRESEGVAAQLLIQAGVQADAVRGKVLDLLRGFTPKGGGAAGPGPAGATGGGSRGPEYTPGAQTLQGKAVARAGRRVASFHYLLAMFDDPDSVAARVLTSLGVTEAAVADRVAAIGDAGTTDEVPKPAGGRGFDLHLGDGFTLRIEDPELASSLRATPVEAGAGATAGELAAMVRRVLADYLRPPDASGDTTARAAAGTAGEADGADGPDGSGDEEGKGPSS